MRGTARGLVRSTQQIEAAQSLVVLSRQRNTHSSTLALLVYQILQPGFDPLVYMHHTTDENLARDVADLTASLQQNRIDSNLPKSPNAAAHEQVICPKLITGLARDRKNIQLATRWHDALFARSQTVAKKYASFADTLFDWNAWVRAQRPKSQRGVFLGWLDRWSQQGDNLRLSTIRYVLGEIDALVHGFEQSLGSTQTKVLSKDDAKELDSVGELRYSDISRSKAFLDTLRDGSEGLQSKALRDELRCSDVLQSKEFQCWLQQSEQVAQKITFNNVMSNLRDLAVGRHRDYTAEQVTQLQQHRQFFKLIATARLGKASKPVTVKSSEGINDLTLSSRFYHHFGFSISRFKKSLNDLDRSGNVLDELCSVLNDAGDCQEFLESLRDTAGSEMDQVLDQLFIQAQRWETYLISSETQKQLDQMINRLMYYKDIVLDILAAKPADAKYVSEFAEGPLKKYFANADSNELFNLVKDRSALINALGTGRLRDDFISAAEILLAKVAEIKAKQPFVHKTDQAILKQYRDDFKKPSLFAWLVMSRGLFNDDIDRVDSTFSQIPWYWEDIVRRADQWLSHESSWVRGQDRLLASRLITAARWEEVTLWKDDMLAAQRMIAAAPATVDVSSKSEAKDHDLSFYRRPMLKLLALLKQHPSSSDLSEDFNALFQLGLGERAGKCLKNSKAVAKFLTKILTEAAGGLSFDHAQINKLAELYDMFGRYDATDLQHVFLQVLSQHCLGLLVLINRLSTAGYKTMLPDGNNMLQAQLVIAAKSGGRYFSAVDSDSSLLQGKAFKRFFLALTNSQSPRLNKKFTAIINSSLPCDPAKGAALPETLDFSGAVQWFYQMLDKAQADLSYDHSDVNLLAQLLGVFEQYGSTALAKVFFQSLCQKQLAFSVLINREVKFERGIFNGVHRKDERHYEGMSRSYVKNLNSKFFGVLSKPDDEHSELKARFMDAARDSARGFFQTEQENQPGFLALINDLKEDGDKPLLNGLGLYAGAVAQWESAWMADAITNELRQTPAIFTALRHPHTFIEIFEKYSYAVEDRGQLNYQWLIPLVEQYQNDPKLREAFLALENDNVAALRVYFFNQLDLTRLLSPHLCDFEFLEDHLTRKLLPYIEPEEVVVLDEEKDVPFTLSDATVHAAFPDQLPSIAVKPSLTEVSDDDSYEPLLARENIYAVHSRDPESIVEPLARVRTIPSLAPSATRTGAAVKVFANLASAEAIPKTSSRWSGWRIAKLVGLIALGIVSLVLIATGVAAIGGFVIAGKVVAIGGKGFGVGVTAVKASSIGLGVATGTGSGVGMFNMRREKSAQVLPQGVVDQQVFDTPVPAALA